MKAETFSFLETDSLTLSASFYRSSAPQKKQTIIYFHGGGLIWGSRNDLPEEYISLFLNAGYHFLTVDYPLAPETSLPQIYGSSVKAVEWFGNHFDSLLNLSSPDYILFGRSAGAYLAFLLVRDTELPIKPKRLISFYGYPSIQEPFYLSPSSYYQTFPDIPKILVDQLTQPTPLAKGILENRYAIYIYARQKGKWLDLVLPDQKEKDRFSLTEQELKTLPPTFLAQSKTDKDVPYQTAVQLKQTIPDAELFSVENAKHDFDSDPTDKTAQEAYLNLIQWLQKEL